MHTLIFGPCFKVDSDVIKRKLFASCNAVFNNSMHRLDLLRLQLSESYCLPVLQYCLGAITFSTSQLRELNAYWNMVYRRIFGFPSCEIGQTVHLWSWSTQFFDLYESNGCR